MYPDHHFTVIFIQTCVLLCMSCYYFYIVLSLYLYCRYVVYLEHHFTVISRQTLRSHNGPDYMVVGFTTTFANQCQSSLILCIRIRERCTTLCDKFVCDLRQTVVSFWVLRFFPPIKLGLKVCLFAWWCLTPLSTIFQLFRGGQFYWWKKPEDPERNNSLSQVTDKFIT
jgi:hypothetical protein